MRLKLISGEYVEFEPSYEGFTDNQKGCLRGPYPTGLKGPRDIVFVKWMVGRKATAHELLVESYKKPLPGTPALLGWAQDRADFIYVFECLSNRFKNLHELLDDSVTGRDLVTKQIMMSVVEQMIKTFEAIEETGRGAPRGKKSSDRNLYRHIYTDFTAKNIMIDPVAHEVSLIDLDSASTYASLLPYRHMRSVDRQYWYLWTDYLKKRRQIDEFMLAQLPKVMVLSFGAVWTRALGLINDSRRAPDDAVKLVREPLVEEQYPLWEALKNGKDDEFKEYLLYPSAVGAVFGKWQELLNNLTNAPAVTWEEVREAITAISQPAQNPSSPQSLDQPSRDNFNDLREGLWHGLIDPFGILRAKGIVKRKSARY